MNKEERLERVARLIEQGYLTHDYESRTIELTPKGIIKFGNLEAAISSPDD